MVKKMLINACHPEECRVAVVADGLLEELDVEVNTREATLGNIYKAKVTRVEPSLQAVFVDYGWGRNGFLSINDVHPSYFPESYERTRRRPRIQEVFKKDDDVIVQVNKEERSKKGASLTTNISLAGRYLVLMPGTDLCGVSRKIEDEKERKKLKEILSQLKLPDNMGFIIRTAGMGHTKTELSRDLEYLLKLWQSIEKNVNEKPAPALLHREQDLVIRAIREHYTPEVSEILVDDKGVHKKVREFFHEVMPKYEKLVKLYQEKRPLFNKYQLEEQIAHVYSRRIKLKSGGHIVIEPTEAMVSIDVNSGGATKEKDIEETAFKVNLEAAPEIARQLRLRDLGGIIVIDFIDMTSKKHKQEVEKALKAALKQDRAKAKVLRISALGLIELSRQRLKSSLGTGEYLDCPVCEGSGKVRSPEMCALAAFRRIKSAVGKPDVSEIRATVPRKVAEYLLNSMRAQLVDLERQYLTRINITAGPSVSEHDMTVEAVKEEIAEVRLDAASIAPLPQANIAVPGPTESVEAPLPQEGMLGRGRRGARKRPEADREAEGESGETLPDYEIVEGPLSVFEKEFQLDQLEFALEKATQNSPGSAEVTENGMELCPTEEAHRIQWKEEGNFPGEQRAEEALANDERETKFMDDFRDDEPAEEFSSTERREEQELPRRKSLLRTYLPFLR